MPITMKQSAVVVLPLSLFFIPHSAHASEQCRIAGNIFASFGDIRSGSSPAIPLKTDIRCDNKTSGNEQVRWARICLTVDRPPMMHNEGAQRQALLYDIFQTGAPGASISKTHFISMDWPLEAGKLNQHIPLLLNARIRSQQQVAAGDYYDRGETAVLMRYDINEKKSNLSKCGAMDSEIVESRMAARATVVSGCELIGVNALNFGSRNPTEGSQLMASAMTNIRVRCPMNTTFSVALDMGQHDGGNNRMMCKDKYCIAYGIYQDASFNTPWNNRNNILRMTADSNRDLSIPVYGYVPAQSWPSAGKYEDTVVVTLSY